MRRIFFILILFFTAVIYSFGCGGDASQVSSNDDPDDEPTLGDDELSVADLDGATDVDPSKSFVYLFDEAIDETTVTDESFFITLAVNANLSSPLKAAFTSDACNPENKITAAVTTESRKAILDPENNLIGGAVYTICLTTDILYAGASTSLMSSLKAEESTGFDGFAATFTVSTSGITCDTSADCGEEETCFFGLCRNAADIGVDLSTTCSTPDNDICGSNEGCLPISVYGECGIYCFSPSTFMNNSIGYPDCDMSDSSCQACDDAGGSLVNTGDSEDTYVCLPPDVSDCFPDDGDDGDDNNNPDPYGYNRALEWTSFDVVPESDHIMIAMGRGVVEGDLPAMDVFIGMDNGNGLINYDQWFYYFEQTTPAVATFEDEAEDSAVTILQTETGGIYSYALALVNEHLYLVQIKDLTQNPVIHTITKLTDDNALDQASIYPMQQGLDDEEADVYIAYAKSDNSAPYFIRCVATPDDTGITCNNPMAIPDIYANLSINIIAPETNLIFVASGYGESTPCQRGWIRVSKSTDLGATWVTTTVKDPGCVDNEIIDINAKLSIRPETSGIVDLFAAMFDPSDADSFMIWQTSTLDNGTTWDVDGYTAVDGITIATRSTFFDTFQSTADGKDVTMVYGDESESGDGSIGLWYTTCTLSDGLDPHPASCVSGNVMSHPDDVENGRIIMEGNNGHWMAFFKWSIDMRYLWSSEGPIPDWQSGPYLE